jgi:subtilase family protein/fibronectin type III domain protein/PA domain-containing protein/pre-peptidase/peptidase inhibitor I9
MRRYLNILSILVMLAVAFSAVIPAAAQTDAKSNGGNGGNVRQSSNGVYIVQMLDDPVVAYNGDIPGLNATRPGRGQKIDPNSPDVTRYAAYLDARHDEALDLAGGGQKLYDYHFSYNGFAAKLGLDQANRLTTIPGVLNVSPDEMVSVDTSSTPTFLGLDAPGGLWDQLGGVGHAGEDIIIGVVDSGIWPESLSFSDRTGQNGNASQDGKLSYQQIPGWHGKCSPGEQFNAANCNQKLIGAQYFDAAWGGNAAIDAQRPWEFTSPRDYNGHGTHTSSTAGGNHGVPTTGPAAGFGSISGMAPRARIAMYKALWSTQDASTASGFTSDLVEAIDQAVADGVDVINYSISGTQTNFLDPVQVSFLFAADAGVFVAASAGNSGPATSTVAHPGPWLTTVAAGTHNRNGDGSVTLGNGATYFGASVASAVGPAPLIDSTTAGLSGADPTKVALCYSTVDNGGVAVLDPAKVAGKIVICDRGVTARVNKSLAVKEAGGVGMILVNTSLNSINADFHFVPSVHLQSTDRAAVKAYATTVNPTATINQATIVLNAPAPFTATFSSRGPLLAGGGDLLKPDVIAPGQDILAAVAPPGQAGLEFNLLSGTSMSSPHVAGLAALLKDLHPDWTPMMIKSALMTSAYDVLDGPGTNPIVIFRQGAGHVRPNSAADPGLVYDSGFNDWLAFLCGTTNGVNPSTCTALAGLGYSFDPSNLNLASIAIGDLAGVQTVTRTVMNVGSGAATYTASVAGMAGVNVVVSPSSLTLNPGETATYTVTFTTAGAALNVYTGGQLTWSDGSHNVRSPIVIKPVALSAPASVFSNGDPASYNVTFGYTGPFTATPRGLVPATTFAGNVVDDPTDNFVVGGPGTTSFSVVVPAGTTYARFSLFNEFTDGADDLDLYVYNSGGTLVGASGGGTAAEEVNLVNPAPGTYTVWVHGFATDGPDANFTLFSWVLGSANAGNMTVSAPPSATLGSTGTINLTFSGLAPGTRYLGSVAYSGAAGMPNPTIIRVDTP